MKSAFSLAALRPATSYHLGAGSWRAPTAVASARSYATPNSPGPDSAGTGAKKNRRSVTPFNDNGYVPWSELSIPEKAARATQQSFNFGLVLVGLVLTGGVGYFLWADVFSPNSKTVQFNRAVDRIKSDQRCLKLFGEAGKILAHGEETNNKGQRARPLASSEDVDKQGVYHLRLHFHVEGPLNHGVAQVHMVKLPGQSSYEYKYFFVDVKGHGRIYLENADAGKTRPSIKPFRLFGARWG